MKKKGLDGLTVKFSGELKYMCCYTDSGRFRDDLTEHIARGHLQIKDSDFKGLNTSQCSQCHQESTVVIQKPPNKSSYRFIQHCSCESSTGRVLHTMEKPWTDVSLQEICDLLARYTKHTESYHSQGIHSKLFKISNENSGTKRNESTAIVPELTVSWKRPLPLQGTLNQRILSAHSLPRNDDFTFKDFDSIDNETQQSAMKVLEPMPLRQRSVLRQNSPNQQTSFNYTLAQNNHFKQQENHTSPNKLCQFLTLFLFIAVVGWLIFSYLPQLLN